MSDCYMPEYARGIRWDDKAIGIKWPIKPTTISENDQSYRLL
jgi:dTDP-4-dehydrorhamnose 3,5-epimerase